MGMVEVSVNGRQHQLQVDTGQEARARRLASYVDGVTAKLLQQHGPVGEGKLLLLTSIMIADEYADALEELKRLRAGVDKGDHGRDAEAAAALDRVAQRLDQLAAALENA